MTDATSSGGVSRLLGELFSGGALTQFAIFALGDLALHHPSIIMQILGVVIPKHRAVAAAGCGWPAQDHAVDPLPDDRDRDRAVHGFAFLFHNGAGGFGSGSSATVGTSASTCCRLHCAPTSAWWCSPSRAGTALLMWMGELITQKGVGNGMSILIFASVVATSLPARASTGLARRTNGIGR